MVLAKATTATCATGNAAPTLLQNVDSVFNASDFEVLPACDAACVVGDPVEGPVFAVAYNTSRARQTLCIILSIATFGLFGLFIRWFPILSFHLRCVRCAAKDAEFLLLESLKADGTRKARVVDAVHARLRPEAFRVGTTATARDMPCPNQPGDASSPARRPSSVCAGCRHGLMHHGGLAGVGGVEKQHFIQETNEIQLADNEATGTPFRHLSNAGGCGDVCGVCRGPVQSKVDVLLFVFRCKRYILQPFGRVFQEVYFDTSLPFAAIHTIGNGLSDPTLVADRRSLYGACSMRLPVTSPLALFCDEILHPTYVFQVAGIAFWLWDRYYSYAVAVLLIFVASIIVELIDILNNEAQQRNLCNFECAVTVLQKSEGVAAPITTRKTTATSSTTIAAATTPRKQSVISGENRVAADKVWQIRSIDLVPGHVFEVEPDMILPCDAILLSGTAVVNESMLTGESLPIMKSALPPRAAPTEVFCIDENSPSSLYSGSRVVAVKRSNAANPRVLALVARTGFSTYQGSMMRTILHPPPTRFSFYVDSFKFLAVLFAVALVGGVLTIVVSMSQLSKTEIFVRCIDLIFVAVPPALPSAMTVGTSIAVSRLLRKWNIACISPTRVNVAGQVNTMVFDKTGTLTESTLDLEGAVAATGTAQEALSLSDGAGRSVAGNVPPDTDTAHRESGLSSLQQDSSEMPRQFVQAMATCHSLTVVDGGLVGEPIEQLMMGLSGWVLDGRGRGRDAADRGDADRQKEDDNRSYCQTVGPMASLDSDSGGGVSREALAESVDGAIRLTRKIKESRCWYLDKSSDVRPDDRSPQSSRVATLSTSADGACITASQFTESAGPEETFCSLVLNPPTREMERAMTDGQVEEALNDASKFQLSAAFSKLYDCGSSVPVTVRPPASKGALAMLLKAGVTLEEITSGARWRHLVGKAGGDGVGGKTVGTDDESCVELGIIKRFDFIARLQRMSVVVRDPLTQEVFVYCKGAPEKMAELSRPDTLPRNLDATLMKYTQKGMRVLGFVGKSLGVLSADAVENLERSQAESDLTFLGLMVFTNRLKPDTRTSVTELRRAGCFCLMATGDNSLTAVAVSRESGLLDDHQRSSGLILCDLGKSSPDFAAEAIRWTVMSDTDDTVDVVSDLPHDGAEGESFAKSKPISVDDLRLLLRGNDHRTFTFVVTGRAFRFMQQQHDDFGLAWTDVTEQQRALGALRRSSRVWSSADRSDLRDERSATASIGLGESSNATSRCGFCSSSQFSLIRRTEYGCCEVCGGGVDGRPDPETRLTGGQDEEAVSLLVEAHPQLGRGDRHSRPTRGGAHGGCRNIGSSGMGFVGCGDGRPEEDSKPCGEDFGREPGARDDGGGVSGWKSRSPGLDDADGDLPREGDGSISGRCCGGRRPSETASWVLSFRVDRRQLMHDGRGVGGDVYGGVGGDLESGETKALIGRGGDGDSRCCARWHGDNRSSGRSRYGGLFTPHSQANDSGCGDSSDSCGDGHDGVGRGSTPWTSSVVRWDRGLLGRGAKSSRSLVSMSDHFADQHFPPTDDGDASTSYEVRMSLFEFVLRNVTVYSRMSPDDKELLVNCLRYLPHNPLVGMCGDGANDCAALKSADIGISLSDSEASIVAPFTSSLHSIKSCVVVLREGRAALVNSIQVFKFIALYSLVEFSSVSILYWFGSNLTMNQYTWVDLFAVLPLSVLMSWTVPADDLADRLPLGSLVSPSILVSMLGQAFIHCIFTAVAAYFLSIQSFYIPYRANENTGVEMGAELESHVNTAVFLVSNLQYPIVCFAISRCRPWRKAVWTNIAFIGWLLLIVACGITMVLLNGPTKPLPMEWLATVLNLVPLPWTYRRMMLGIVFLNALASCLLEILVVRWLGQRDEIRELTKHHISAQPLPLHPGIDVASR